MSIAQWMSNKARSLILKVPLYLLLLQYFCPLHWQSMRAVNQQGRAGQWDSFTPLGAAPLSVVIMPWSWHVVKAVLERALRSHSKASERKGKGLAVIGQEGEGRDEGNALGYHT